MDLTTTFNTAAGPDGDAASVTQGPSPSGPAPPSVTGDMVLMQTQADPTLPLTLEHALAELEMLERGRAKPAPRLNDDPPKRLKLPVDSKVERDREARASALRAYVQFQELELDHTLSHARGEEFELDW